ncbi:uncharacterized protein LOC108738196 isoform X2 [Agrilus planipennis]|uniref:Uncharacterized protein LOC108738196 isoform X2 n=1 Tax=Agrilus planipennis TaxID=224129 RepID=A0A1W4X3N1_AGRPL|nr:uncharacterized protein LOC108738196 isoform X2 [Agrilus planipennis]
MIWSLKLICCTIFIQNSAYGFPAYVPEWNNYPSSGWNPSDWMYNYGAPSVNDHHFEHDHDHDHEKDHHHVNQQQIIIHDSVPTTLTAKESYRDSNGNVIQDMITHITTTGFDYSNESIPDDNAVTVKKIKRNQPMFKTKSTNNKKNRMKNTKRNNGKRKRINSSNTKKSSPLKQRRKTTSTSSKRKLSDINKKLYRSRNRFCEFDELCRYQQLQPIRRRPYFDYDYYNSLPFRYNRFRYRDPLPYNSQLEDDDYYDYIENLNKDSDQRPAKQQTSSESNSDETIESSSTTTEQSTTSTDMSTTTVSTTTNNATGYGYGPSNGNENDRQETITTL